MSILIVLYICGVFPWLFGNLGKHCLRNRIELPAYVVGHGLQFIILGLCGLVLHALEISVVSFAMVYGVCTVVVGIFCVIMTCREWHLPDMSGMNKWIFIGELVIMLGCILITIPHWQDHSEELMYQFASTGVLGDNGYLLHAIALQLSGMNSVTFIRLLMPICFLPLVFSAYGWLSRGRIWFLIFAYAMFGGYIFTTGYVGLEAFLNSWNPVTITVSIFLPLLMVSFAHRSYVDCALMVLGILALHREAMVYIIAMLLVYAVIRWIYNITGKKGGVNP